MYYVYILRCEDDSLYTGITTDPERRIKEHISGGIKCARYTRSHPPKRAEKVFETVSKSAASTLEYRIKELPRKKKEKLIESGSLKDFFAEKIETAEYGMCDSDFITYLNRIFEAEGFREKNAGE